MNLCGTDTLLVVVFSSQPMPLCNHYKRRFRDGVYDRSVGYTYENLAHDTFKCACTFNVWLDRSRGLLEL